MKKKSLFLTSLLILLGLLLVGCGQTTAKKQASHPVKIGTVAKGKSSTCPTFFFHGWGSSINAERHMVHAAVQKGVTRTVLTAIVKKNGHVQVTGNWAKGAKNPIIMVGFQDNRNANYRTDARYADTAVQAVERRHNFRQMNLVGHSMGNMDIMFMLLYYGRRPDFPQLKRQVDIAGHFNGIRGLQSTAYSHPAANGRPARMDHDYRQLLRLRSTYPKGVKVMNIYGNLLNGTESDRDVTIYSAQTLKYLVGPRAGHYEEQMITGKNAEHSRLHENPQVDQLLVRFLWGK